ncbi:hypothetical protein C4565_00530 [Candidatus Parcubacteria bacterium]|nr:MAG: hypothetical protein C4565_00530 [Candidatus Parcubacteria bacterium]
MRELLQERKLPTHEQSSRLIVAIKTLGDHFTFVRIISDLTSIADALPFGVFKVVMTTTTLAVRHFAPFHRTKVVFHGPFSLGNFRL